ncbi:MAG: maleylacetate reductase [Proteobacteria bacterium]|nr:maleylacetate reductase [Pseudomonadota bacterium]
MRDFTFQALPTRVILGSGTIERLPDEIRRMGLSRVLVLSTPQQAGEAERLAASFGPLAAGTFSGATMHTPVAVTEAALAVVREMRADGVVSVGGGSTTGLGKAIAVNTDLPQIVVPTTYAGSEMTDILGETRDGVKTTRRSPAIQPETVIYDIDLTLGLPVGMSATSGLNAIAHAVEALYAEDGSPLVSLMAEAGIAAFAKALPVIVAEPRNGEARADALYGSWLCGTCLGMVSMALHHKLCHTLGGTFDMPHAETHSIVLPHATAYNAPAVPEAMARIAKALSAPDAAQGLYDLAGRIGAPRALKDIGMPESGIDRAADLAVANPYRNPRPVEREAVRRLIARAWAGEPPTA